MPFPCPLALYALRLLLRLADLLQLRLRLLLLDFDLYNSRAPMGERLTPGDFDELLDTGRLRLLLARVDFDFDRERETDFDADLARLLLLALRAEPEELGTLFKGIFRLGELDGVLFSLAALFFCVESCFGVSALLWGSFSAGTSALGGDGSRTFFFEMPLPSLLLWEPSSDALAAAGRLLLAGSGEVDWLETRDGFFFFFELLASNLVSISSTVASNLFAVARRVVISFRLESNFAAYLSTRS